MSKVENSWDTTYRGVISNYTEEWCKIIRGIDLSFQNWHKELWILTQEPRKPQKLTL